MLIWRLCLARWGATAFSGEGGMYTPGRWHHIGNRIVYTSQSLALAALETWLHVPARKPVGTFVSIRAEIPATLPVETFDETRFPQGWVGREPPLEQRDYGTNWLKHGNSAVLRVPAVATRGEFNYLLNPAHSDFAEIEIGDPEPFEFDPRMWKKNV